MSIELSEEEKKLFAEEIMRLNNITNKLWQKGLDVDFVNMTHTELGITTYDNKKKRENLTSIVPSIFRKKINNQKINIRNAPRYSITLNSKRNYNKFMSI